MSVYIGRVKELMNGEREIEICAVRGSSLLGNAGKQRGLHVGCGQKKDVHDCFGFTTLCIIGKNSKEKNDLSQYQNLKEEVSMGFTH